MTPAHIEKLDADRRDAESLRVRLVEEEAARKKMESDLKAKEQELMPENVMEAVSKIGQALP